MYQARCCVTSSCYSGPMRRESVCGLPSADTTVLYVELPSHTHTQPLNFKYSVYQLFRLVHCTCVYQPNQNAPQISLKGGNIKVTGMEERKWAGCDESRQLGEAKKRGGEMPKLNLIYTVGLHTYCMMHHNSTSQCITV